MENNIYYIVVSCAIFFCGLVPTLLTLWLNERVKGSVQSSFNKSLEELKKEHSKEVSQFQTELNHLKSKENFKFTKLHERRFEVLQKTFEHLITNLSLLSSHTSVYKFTPDGENFEENEKKASEQYKDAHNKFLEYFSFNSIYFDRETEALLLSFFQETAEIFHTYNQRQIMKSMGDKLDREDNLKSIMVYKKIPEIIYPLKKQIETKFRELLGE
ncbi:hypothetical protein D3C87_1146930 [compost metagenome]